MLPSYADGLKPLMESLKFGRMDFPELGQQIQVDIIVMQQIGILKGDIMDIPMFLKTTTGTQVIPGLK
jgi:hypothetical protein